MSFSKYKLVVAIELLMLTGSLFFIFYPPSLPLSPLSLVPIKTPNPKPNNYIVLGFAPYWNLKKLTNDSLTTITHFGYFALYLEGDGSIQTHVNKRELEPGFNNYNRLLKSLPTNPLILTFMQKDQDSLVNLLSSKTNRANAINTILGKVKESNATGVNIDFEPTIETSSSLRDNYSLFIKELHNQIDTSSSILLTISIYPSATARPRIWDLKTLSQEVDYFVVMTYDYTMPKSDNSGPNSPLRDINGDFEHNIVKNIAELTSQLEPRKLLLGIPLYGYEWDTVDDSKYSPTIGRGVTTSLEKIEEMLNNHILEMVWDRNTLTAYGVATVSGNTSQIYFDNETSLRLKLDFVKDADLGGIAVWALGYDNNVPWLWPTISQLKQ